MIICADDYGMSPSVNQAILKLCRLRTISAVSVLIKKTDKSDAESLKSFRDPLLLGLHIELFGTNPFGAAEECNSQIKRFIDHFGFFPDFIDGHMHCQIYPFWGGRIIRVVLQHQRPPNFFIRSVVLTPQLLRTSSRFSNTVYLHWLNFLGRSFRKKLIAHGIRTNDTCWGVFNGHTNIREVFSAAKEQKNGSALLFIHPGLKKEDGVNRIAEYEFIRQL